MAHNNVTSPIIVIQSLLNDYTEIIVEFIIEWLRWKFLILCSNVYKTGSFREFRSSMSIIEG